MKCLFRTERKVRFITYATKGNEMDYDETVEFAECLKQECPYYGKTVLEHRPMGGFQTVIRPVCRRADNAAD